jgi:ribosomal protein RSM22 (predicted rRNA methylase)
MNLPTKLEEAIISLCDGISEKDLSRATQELTTCYQTFKSHQTELHRLAYLITRLPATYAALCRVFQEFEVPETVLDCGAGPGTSIWALPGHSLTLIEKDPSFVKLGKKLSPNSQATWKTQSFLEIEDRAEMILFSYSLNEIPPSKLADVIYNAYTQTDNLITIIEPGTSEGFERICKIRTQLLTLGMSLLAPCPHHKKCPMKGDNWCHFSVRLPRTSLHRRIKKGTLGFEDEKFSYLVASKKPFSPIGKRILRHPIKKRGHVIVDLCTNEGVERKVFTKLKKPKWGDLII